MPTITDPGARSTEGPITFADVLALVPVDAATGALRADSTNAGAIRAALGRGSTTTVQRHLDAIRAEVAAAAAPQPTGAAPAAPAEAVAAIWSAAWSAAQRDMLQRLDRTTAERDAARQQVAVLTADRDAAAAEADEQRDLAAAAVQARNQAQTVLAEREAALQGQVEVEAKGRAAAEAALVAECEQAAQAAKLAAAIWEIERQTLQAQIDRLEARMAELRALEIWAAGQAGPKVEPSEVKPPAA